MEGNQEVAHLPVNLGSRVKIIVFPNPVQSWQLVLAEQAFRPEHF
jgi:hypothetical protein